MLEEVDKYGTINQPKARLGRYLNPIEQAQLYWLIKIPNQSKYTKFELINKTSIRIQKQRRALTILLPITFGLGAILLLSV
jgi:hypothetical protein